MTSTTFVEIGTSAVDRSKSQAMRRVARRQRLLFNTGAAVISILLVIWTILPIYNIVMVSLESQRPVQRPHLAG